MATKTGYVTNIERDTLANEDSRRVVFTGPKAQLVLMTLQPGPPEAGVSSLWSASFASPMAVVLMNYGVSLPASDEPAVDRKRRGAGDQQRHGEAPPEQRRLEPGLHCARDDEHDRVVDDLHDRDGDGGRGERESDRPAYGQPRAQKGPQGHRVAERNASTTDSAIVAALLHARTVPMTMPRISPMAPPVRQCAVALKAKRLSEAG